MCGYVKDVKISSSVTGPAGAGEVSGTETSLLPSVVGDLVTLLLILFDSDAWTALLSGFSRITVIFTIIIGYQERLPESLLCTSAVLRALHVVVCWVLTTTP